MAPTTDGARTAGGAADFYDALAGHYDAMTDLPGRFGREEPAMRAFVQRFAIRTAIDAGSGTGFLALLLARLGVSATAVDCSAAMLRRAEENAAALGLVVRTLRAELGELSPGLIPPADAVFCMGNTLAHVPGPAALPAVVRAFHSVIRPGGRLVLQLLNYKRILAGRERIQSIRDAGDMTFVRFYDFEPGRVVFNILRIERSATGPRHTLTSVPLYPFTAEEIGSALAGADFPEVDLCEDLALRPFREAESRDILVLARRST